MKSTAIPEFSYYFEQTFCGILMPPIQVEKVEKNTGTNWYNDPFVDSFWKDLSIGVSFNLDAKSLRNIR